MRQLKITKQITDRSSRSIDAYLQEISKIEMVTPEEEVELSKRIQQGDRAAMERLVRANLRFVVSVAKQYQNMGMTLADLINEGNCGLIKAAERFDATKGFKFISYAVWWIRQSILKALAEHSRIIRLPLNQIGTLNKMNREFSKLEQKHEREPTADELATSLEVTEQKVSDTLRNSKGHVSMDSPMKDDEEFSLKDVLENKETPRTDEASMMDSLKKEIRRSLSYLPEREKKILEMSFGIGRDHEASLEEIAMRMGMSKENVRRIKNKAIRRLRRADRNGALKAYLEHF